MITRTRPFRAVESVERVEQRVDQRVESGLDTRPHPWRGVPVCARAQSLDAGAGARGGAGSLLRDCPLLLIRPGLPPNREHGNGHMLAGGVGLGHVFSECDGTACES